MEDKDYRPGNLVRAKKEYIGDSFEVSEGEVFELPNSGDVIHKTEYHDTGEPTISLKLEDCEPVLADIFALKKLDFEQKPNVSWKGNGADHQPEGSGTTQIDFVYKNRFTFRFEEWHYTDKDGKLQFENSTHLIFGEWYEKIADTVPMDNEIEFVHQLQNWYYLFTGEEITFKKDK